MDEVANSAANPSAAHRDAMANRLELPALKVDVVVAISVAASTSALEATPSKPCLISGGAACALWRPRGLRDSNNRFSIDFKRQRCWLLLKNRSIVQPDGFIAFTCSLPHAFDINDLDMAATVLDQSRLCSFTAILVTLGRRTPIISAKNSCVSGR